MFKKEDFYVGSPVDIDHYEDGVKFSVLMKSPPSSMRSIASSRGAKVKGMKVQIHPDTPECKSERDERVANRPKGVVYRALFNYNNEGDLCFRANQLILVLDTGSGPNDWWEGVIDGRQGLFPGTYATKMTYQPADVSNFWEKPATDVFVSGPPQSSSAPPLERANDDKEEGADKFEVLDSQNFKEPKPVLILSGFNQFGADEEEDEEASVDDGPAPMNTVENPNPAKIQALPVISQEPAKPVLILGSSQPAPTPVRTPSQSSMTLASPSSDSLSSKSPGPSTGTSSPSKDAAQHSDSDSDEESSVSPRKNSKEEVNVSTLFPDAAKYGFLNKKGGGKSNVGRMQGSIFARRNWKTRWFVLRDNRLYYYKTVPKATSDKPLGYIVLCGETQILQGENVGFSIKTPDRTFFIKALDIGSAFDWVKVLRENCFKEPLTGEC